MADNDATVRRLIRRYLTRIGYRVREAADAEEALLIATRSAAVDALITDTALPGMNGVELASRLSRQRPGLKLIYVSSYLPVHQKALSLAVVEGVFLGKPFAVENLARKLDALAGAARADTAPR